ncbi:Elongation factor Tu, mitochondrial [Holothuria leucospilota]|uniref:Elongation factor Tu, mitochondrial n=1 Tax=Holothuria leucospilota TaxID=206669 RepID=A0A9Q0YLZ5_HOLLE|nr:Elongation factor Tu, mitochondrial [Holothuria leucospilota]
MAKLHFERYKPHLNVATIGHVDHGKSTLTAAITKAMSTCGLGKVISLGDIFNPEEKERGISISPKYFEYETENRHYAHIDCPGHAGYLKNLLWGVSQADCAILVVSSADGPMPQTREHILCARQMGVSHIVVFLNVKYDTDEELEELVQLEIRELLTEYGFDGENLPVVKGSALHALESTGHKDGDANCIYKLLEEMDSYLPIPERDLGKPFMMMVGNVYSLPGMESFGKILNKAEAGDHMAIQLGSDIKRKDIRRGMVVCAPGTVTLHNHVETEMYLLRKEEGGNHTPFFNGYTPQMYQFSWDVEVKVKLPEGTEMAFPGDHLRATWKLLRSMPVGVGQRFSLRNNGRTIGTGVITQILPDL